MQHPDVRVEIVELSHRDGRQISDVGRVTASLRERRKDIEAAIAEAADLLRSAMIITRESGWDVSDLKARFGITLTAEASIIVGRASSEAAFDIEIAINRNQAVGAGPAASEAVGSAPPIGRSGASDAGAQ